MSKLRFPGVRRGAVGGFRPVEFEFAVKSFQILPVRAETMDPTIPIFLSVQRVSLFIVIYNIL